MLRLSTPGFSRFEQAPHLDVTYAGAEANVAVSLVNLGRSADFVTRLPGNDIARRAICELRGFGVGTRWIVEGGDRIAHDGGRAIDLRGERFEPAGGWRGEQL